MSNLFQWRVIPFPGSQLQEACQRILIIAFTWDLVGKKTKKDRGMGNSPALFLPKEANELNVISQQSDQGLSLEPPIPFYHSSPLGSS